ncbi:HOMEOBOX PROTEIN TRANSCRIPTION FACTORS [Salix purpurea]|uniref:HOMEOBOX PROTEIN TRANSCRIPTION FACTORS n=1 Tax=Salix purpurea TaxID=77065 RepID=A0A9Q0PRI3_SALPP|nr:HOMEOBOX PROTEIN TRANSCRIPTION FACTORS [Salix purpurea]
MATYYTSSNNQRDAAAMVYLPGSYPEAPVLPGNIMMYMNSGSYSDNLAGNPHHQNNCIEFQSVENSGSTPQQQEILSNLGGSRIGEHDFGAWRDGRNEMLVMHSVSGASSILHGAQSLQGQGLSLSLGTQIPSGMQMPSIPYRNTNPGLTSFLTPNSSISGEGGGRNGSSRDEQSRNIEYLTPGFSGGNHDVNKGDLSLYGMNSTGRTIPNPKYLKAAQQLLDEVVNVRKAIKQPDKEKNQTMSEYGLNSAKAGDSRSKNGAPNPQESTDSPSELSHAERQELQNKLTKLLSMLDEVTLKYYCSVSLIVNQSFFFFYLSRTLTNHYDFYGNACPHLSLQSYIYLCQLAWGPCLAI